MRYKPVMLLITDGWGVSPENEREFDATAIAPTPNVDRLKANYPFTTLVASGEDVGLPTGQMGNSRSAILISAQAGSSIRS